MVHFLIGFLICISIVVSVCAYLDDNKEMTIKGLISIIGLIIVLFLSILHNIIVEEAEKECTDKGGTRIALNGVYKCTKIEIID